jgi:hypothetical protein
MGTILGTLFEVMPVFCQITPTLAAKAQTHRAEALAESPRRYQVLAHSRRDDAAAPGG